MTIYIDVVIMENLIMNSIILYATAIVSKTKISYLRLFLASLLGAIYSVIAYVSTLPIYSNLLLKFLLSIIITYVAFNPQKMKTMWKQLLLFYLTSFLFGGVAFAFIYLVKPQEILMKNGLFLGTYPLKNVLLAAFVGFVLLVSAFKVVKSKMNQKDLFCEIVISMNGKQIETVAMIDTGNLLKEPITNTPVIVVEHTLLYDCIPKEILNHIECILGGDFSEVPDDVRLNYMTQLKVIPFSSLGKQNGMLLGIKPECVVVKQEEREEKLTNIMIGIYPKSLTKKGEYRALIGMELG